VVMRRLKPMTAEECAEFLRALSDPTRLKIIALLFEREWSVTELAKRLGLSQPHTSHHLGVLRTVGIVETRRQGKHIFYRLSPSFREQAERGEEINLGCCSLRFNLPAPAQWVELE